LCIEDDEIYLLLRKKVLEKSGYNVIGVTSADEALKTLREAPVCAAIADHMLHGSTGTELARKMKRMKPDVPIILFSGTVPRHFEYVDVSLIKVNPRQSSFASCGMLWRGPVPDQELPLCVPCTLKCLADVIFDLRNCALVGLHHS
jgi:hypothetical protein